MKYTAEQIDKWPQIGQDYNEDDGVDSIHAKKINGLWVYAKLYWRYRVASIGWVLEDGKLFEDE